jgi:hypothetical protein
MCIPVDTVAVPPSESSHNKKNAKSGRCVFGLCSGMGSLVLLVRVTRRATRDVTFRGLNFELRVWNDRNTLRYGSWYYSTCASIPTGTWHY